MTYFDYIVLAIFGFSVMIGVMRGLVREVLSILGWISAFLVAQSYTTKLSPLLPNVLPTESFRYLVAFVILFLATLLITSLLAIALSQVFKLTGLGLIDRAFGAAFGILRGVLVVGVLVFLCGLTDIPKKSSWSAAMFSAPLEAMVMSAKSWMPPAIAERISYQ